MGSQKGAESTSNTTSCVPLISIDSMVFKTHLMPKKRHSKVMVMGDVKTARITSTGEAHSVAAANRTRNVPLEIPMRDANG